MNRLKLHTIALKNIKHQHVRTLGLIILVSLLSFVLLSSIILSFNLKNGLECMKDRLGADLIVVPSDNTNDMEGILLQGTPSEFYFDKSNMDKIKDIDGVDKITSQFYLQSLSASCCSAPVQIISFDKNTDFTIMPWIDTFKISNKSGLIVGSDISLENDGTLKLFGESYKVKSVLEKTGTGLDSSVYVDSDNIDSVYKNALSKGASFKDGVSPDKSVSSIMIKVKKGADTQKIVDKIYDELSDVNVIEGQAITKNIASTVGNFSSFIDIYVVLFLAISIVTLYMTALLSVNERKKEFAIMRVLGATKKNVRHILLLESLFIGFIGSVIGSALSLVIMLSFNTFIEDAIGLPYVQPSILTFIVMVAINMLICTVVGPLSSFNAITKISKAETFITMKDNE